MTTPTLLSWSGGKDSAWALHVLRNDPRYEVVGLLTTVTDAYERVAMHGIRRDVLHAQAQATGLPLIEARLPRVADNATYEASFTAALDTVRARWPGLRHIAFGDLYLADIRAYREALCARHHWTPLFPIFATAPDTTALAQTMIAAGLRATLCCVDTQQLAAAFAGREFDPALLADLPQTVDRCGENGEFHTCVHAGEMFSAPLALCSGETVLRDGRFAFTDLALRDGTG
ncbi:MAG: ATP-binding protein [Proteobacteria bacterium]|nr:ATP-binding protein [Pseudomonadota bacterium]MBS0464533.1 ATP-binding protein [Pseudomonadota bacterium]